MHSQVVLHKIPFELLRGLPEEDQAAIRATAGVPLTVVGFSDGQFELEFFDQAGDLHTIWVSERDVAPA